MIESILFEPRIIIALSMLAVASFMDLKKREVHDMVWIAFGSAGALMYVIQPIQNLNLFPLIFGSAVTLVIAYLAYRMGLFGGADALALVALVVIIPSYDGTNMFHGIAPMTILTNAAILASLSVVANVVRNAVSIARGVPLFAGFEESGSKKILAFILGYKASRPAFAYQIEVQAASGKKFDFSLKHAENSDYCTKPGSWVMSGLPFIVYMLGGLVSMVLVGDIMMLLLTRFLG
ncbi:MAG: prepilin peptidase [Nitrososphaerales archaeon]